MGGPCLRCLLALLCTHLWEHAFAIMQRHNAPANSISKAQEGILTGAHSPPRNNEGTGLSLEEVGDCCNRSLQRCWVCHSPRQRERRHVRRCRAKRRVRHHGDVAADLQEHRLPVMKCFCECLVDQVARIGEIAEDCLVAGDRTMTRHLLRHILYYNNNEGRQTRDDV